jgi:hypothetical protein
MTPATYAEARRSAALRCGILFGGARGSRSFGSNRG